MQFGICPYCELPGFVTTVKGSPAGLRVSGKCWTCGYLSGESAAPAEDDASEFSQAPGAQPLADCCGD